jgi:cytoskeletal protein CcmA (bactofilin family)
METPKTGDFAHIGKSVVIKGELSGSEDLYVDGQVSGTIELRNNSLTIGPNGQVRANITAKNVSIQGTVEGNVTAVERVELRKSGVVNGDVFTKRIAIEEGAFLKGKVDIQKDGAQLPRAEGKTGTSTASGSPVTATASAGAAVTSQGLPFDKR